MATTKKSWKLQEFIAHAGNVNCLALGHKSGRVMVTGGEDKKVNMWAVGKPHCIMSLSGHTSPVEAVRFGNAEEMVVAGSMSGALKIWDLEAAKIVRTLTGHKSNIRSLDFHPYGDFVASGSLDTNIKLWDIRRKGCIFTYKGHTNCVNCLRFSPDGRWIASAGEDGMLKMWDLTAGKQLADLKQHSGPVTSVEFHPNEFLLASGSADRTIKFWDLETFQNVSSTDGEAGAIRCIFFHPDGGCIYAGAQDTIKAYGWEPALCLDSLCTSWGKIADMSIAQTQMIGASFSQANVSTYVVDLMKLQPFGGTPVEPSPMPTPATPSGRRSFNSERPPTQSTKQATNMKEEPEETPQPIEEPEDDAKSVADIKDPEDYQEIFQPKYKLAQSPPRIEPFPAPPDNSPPEKDFPVHRVQQVGVPVQTRPSKDVAPPVQTRRETAPPVQTRVPRETVNVPRVAKEPPYAIEAEKPLEPAKTQSVIASNRKEPAGISADDFLPKQRIPTVNQSTVQREMSESEAISSILKGHDSMSAVMSNRQRNLQIVRALWTGGNTKTAIDSAVGMNDQAVIVDILNVLVMRPALWNLDICVTLLPYLKDFLDSKYESYVQVSCNSVKVILKNFASLIKTNLVTPPGVGVDITREERHRKCKQCYMYLMNVRQVLDTKHTTSGKIGSTYRELQLLMGYLD